MKSFELIKKLEKYPLFTENDISKIVNKSPKYTRTLVHRLSKSGMIKKIERGKYTIYDDPMIFSSYIVTPSYLSLWTAFRYYNITQQQPFAIFVMSPVSRKSLIFNNTEIKFIKSKNIFGYKKKRYSDFDIFLADKEKTIIDALLFHLDINNIYNSLGDKELNFEKLADYAKKTKNTSLVKRLGYLLERKNGNSSGLKGKDNNYIKLDNNIKRNGKINHKWKLIINTKI